MILLKNKNQTRCITKVNGIVVDDVMLEAGFEDNFNERTIDVEAEESEVEITSDEEVNFEIL